MRAVIWTTFAPVTTERMAIEFENAHATPSRGANISRISSN